MPNIKEFNPGGIDIRPTEVGVESVAAAARRGGAFFNQAAQAVDTLGQRVGGAIRDAGDAYVRYQDHQQISAGTAAGATFIANYNKDWNDTAKAADPNDPSVAAKWRDERLEPALAKFQEGFTTENSQRWAQQFADRYREHIVTKTSADMAGLAADAIHVNVKTTQNSLGNAVYNDPSSLDMARDTFAHSLDGMVGSSPNLTAAAAGKVKNDLTYETEAHLTRAAVMGTIAKGGDWQRIADDPKNAKYINQAEIEQFARAAKAQQRADQLTEKQLEVYQHQQNTRAVHAESDRIMSEEVAIDPATNRPVLTPKYFKRALDLAKMPDAPDGLARTMLDWGERQQRQKTDAVVDDPGLKADLIGRMVDPDKTMPTVQEVLLAEAKDKLSTKTGAILRQMIKEEEDGPIRDEVFKDTMRGAHGLLGTDPVGQGKYASFVQDFIPKYRAMKRAGTLPDDALDIKNPDSLISKAMKPYQRTPVQIMQDRITRGEFGGGEGVNVVGQTGVSPEGFPAPSGPAIDRLRANPKEKPLFDKIYGPGAADRVLGGE